MAKPKLIDRSKQASLGIAIMARNAEKTLPRLLDSIRPFVKQIVVGVDETTTDRTAKVAKLHGADEVFSLHVSDYHECAIHTRQLAQHFGNARQETFRHLDPTLEFHGWLDADDILVGGEKLQKALGDLPPECLGMWLPYEYGAMTLANGTRRVNTLFHRERFLRTHAPDGYRLNLVWEGRVHETVRVEGVQASWALNDDIVVVHQPGIHQTGDSAPRNLLLLEMDYEEDPTSPRTLNYLGHTYFAMGQWAKAASWYEQLSLVSKNDYELWQAFLYMSSAYENIDDADSAMKAAYAALDVIPVHPDPYFRIAALHKLCGEWDKAVFWNEQGRSPRLKTPPFHVFKNPLDYSYNQRMIQGEAFFHMGRLDEAEFEWSEAAKVFVDDKHAAALADVRAAKANVAAAEGFVSLAANLNGQALSVYEHLPDDVKKFGRTRDLVMPSLLKGRNNTQPRIVFWCGRSVEAWGPPSLNTTGIGGSETAVIEIAARFAKDGWTVDVYNEAERYEGVYDGVGYWDLRRWGTDEKCDVFVSWRHPTAYGMAPNGSKKVLWCHDLHYGPRAVDYTVQQWNHILGVSAWHAKMLERYYDLDDTGFSDGSFYGKRKLVGFAPNGIDTTRFDPTVEKIPFRCVYASSPDRGLDVLLRMWPKVLEAEPQAELHVAYGWDTIDKMILGGRSDLAAFKSQMVPLIEHTPNVVWRGRLPQNELAKLYSESVAWLYPTTFLEVSCISAMEAMAGGAIPVVNAAGALPETIGSAGFLVPGPTTNRGFQDTYPRAALGVLTERNVRLLYSEQARRRASGLTWNDAYLKWKQVLGLTERAEIQEAVLV